MSWRNFERPDRERPHAFRRSLAHRMSWSFSRDGRRRRGAFVFTAALSFILTLASHAVDITPVAASPLVCRAQAPLPFLIRGNYVSGGGDEEERQARRAAHRRAIRYRTERYGYVEGFGEPEWNAKTPTDYSEAMKFMGLRITVSKRVAPALRCVEEEIRSTCGEAYHPDYLSGLRTANTFHNGEVSNHLYGIAVDVDPEHNVCCGCVGPAGAHPVCKRKDASLGERMVMPECWVSVFERYGFYWLGRDPMGDTMHFEFLGDPDRIVLQ
jgi:hypothetical protein